MQIIENIRRRLAVPAKFVVERVFERESTNIERERQRRALSESVDLIESSFGSARAVRTREALLMYSLDQVSKSRNGLFLEFGVYKGSTINLIASLTTSAVHGFDSFEGLPEYWREDFDKGAFRVSALPAVSPNVMLHKGWFSETLPAFLANCTEPVSFLHVDCDLYSSTKTIFSALADRLIPGTIIVFDEYFNYPGWKEGEYKAFMEFVSSGRRFEYLAYNSLAAQVAVRLL
jgi:Macrocin-O-methyltransferase (TylF)